MRLSTFPNPRQVEETSGAKSGRRAAGFHPRSKGGQYKVRKRSSHRYEDLFSLAKFPLRCPIRLRTLASRPPLEIILLAAMSAPLEFRLGDGDREKKTPQTVETEVPSEAERDAQALARLGKKPVLKVHLRHCTVAFQGYESDEAQRRFSFMSMLGFTCTILITWEAELM